ncbi:MAG: DNA/RNA nuclease SfsA [Nannocystaceae bacterium]
MQFTPALTLARFLRRYKRFLVDVEFDDGRIAVAHSTNTGALRGCLVPGAPVAIEAATNPARKLAWTWKMIQVDRNWIGVDTSTAIPLAREALVSGSLLPELAGYDRMISEIGFGVEGRSRVDLLLARGGRAPANKRPTGRELYHGEERVYVELKSTTWVQTRGAHEVACFPDAVTARGRKHLGDLVHMVQQGHRAAMLYIVQRSDATRFAPADDIDPAYGQALRRALALGVEAYAVTTKVDPSGIRLERRIPVHT